MIMVVMLSFTTTTTTTRRCLYNMIVVAFVFVTLLLVVNESKAEDISNNNVSSTTETTESPTVTEDEEIELPSDATTSNTMYPTDEFTTAITSFPTATTDTTYYGSSLCSANAGCVEAFGVDAVGDLSCCPTTMGCYYECCFTAASDDPSGVDGGDDGGPDITLDTSVAPTNGTCSTNSVCNDQGFVGECCPSIHGAYNSCCDDIPVDEGDSCSANSKCNDLGLVGECCPTLLSQVYLDCCDYIPPDNGTCSTNPKCGDLLGLKGECCPTSENNLHLDCCDNIPKKGTCKQNRKCRKLGLNGDCCPTEKGEWLSCCNDAPEVGTCHTNQACADLGLVGDDCCPNSDREFLGCCDTDGGGVDGSEVGEDNDNSNSGNNEEGGGTCTTYTNCNLAGLTGECCPTADENEIYLDCCIDHNLTQDAMCSNHEKCSSLDLVGYCCPTKVSVYLDCCEVVNDVDFEGVVSMNYELAAIGFEEAVSSSPTNPSLFYLCWLMCLVVVVFLG